MKEVEAAIVNIITAWGPPGALAILMWIMLGKSEKREAKKDMRIQMLENQLVESYGERIEAADRIGEAIHDNAAASNNAAKALDALTFEVRTKHHG
jgi:hypothetical protein